MPVDYLTLFIFFNRMFMYGERGCEPLNPGIGIQK